MDRTPRAGAPELSCQWARTAVLQRRGRDSKPRYGCPHNGLRPCRSGRNSRWELKAATRRIPGGMNLSRRDARLSRVGLGQERIELLAGAFHRVRQRVRAARESDRGGARLVVRRRVAHQHRCDLGADARGVEPRRGGVAAFVKPDRLERRVVPAPAGPLGKASRAHHPATVVLPRRAYSWSGAGLPCSRYSTSRWRGAAARQGPRAARHGTCALSR